MFTLVCYAVILIGGFVKDIGRGDMTPDARATSRAGFGIEWGAARPAFTGSAWDSLFTTIEVAAVAAPLTALVGLLSAYVITRHRFVGRRAFEFLTMVSFAIPGTVIGVSYIVAFNVAPLELTGGMAILVLCFVFRNMPVGVRAGVAALAQIDKTLDEASSTLRASTVRTLTRGRAAAAAPGDPRHAGVQLHARDDGGQRGDLPRDGEVQPRDRLHHRPRRGGRVSARDRLFVGADLLHARGAARWCRRLVGEARLGRRAAP